MDVPNIRADPRMGQRAPVYLQVLSRDASKNLAERVGFYYRRYLQVAMNPTLGR